MYLYSENGKDDIRGVEIGTISEESNDAGMVSDKNLHDLCSWQFHSITLYHTH